MISTPTLSDLKSFLNTVGLSNYTEENLKVLLDEKLKQRGVSPKDKNIIRYLMEDILQENKLAFSIDWKWSPQDILGNIQELVKSFQYKVEKEEFIDDTEEWDYKIEVNGRVIENKTALSEIFGFVDLITPILEEDYGKTLLDYNSGGDSMDFILIPKDKRSELESGNLIYFF